MKNTNPSLPLKVILLITCSVLSLTVYSQSDSGSYNYIGIRLGAGPTNIATNAINVHENDLGVSFGIAFEHLQPHKMSWSVGLQSEIKGYTGDMVFYNAMGQIVNEGSFPVTVDYTYIGIPLKIGFISDDRFYKFGNFGICPSYHLNTLITYSQTDLSIFPSSDEIIDYSYENLPFHTFDLSTLGELGLGFKITERFHLYLSGQVQYSLTNQANSDGLTARHYGFSMNLGARFNMTPKVKSNKDPVLHQF